MLGLTRGSWTVGGTCGRISCTNTTRLSATAFQLSGPHEQMSADQGDMQQKINAFSCGAVVLSSGVDTATLWANKVEWHADKLLHGADV